MKYCFITFLLFFTISVFGQKIETELNGFQLGQTRQVPKNEYSTLVTKNKLMDDSEYEVYQVTEDSTVYMVFVYSVNQPNTIWGLQLSGNKYGYDCGFNGLRLGMNPSQIYFKLGKPDTIIANAENTIMLGYNNKNYSLELTKDSTLKTIKLMDLSDHFYPTYDTSKIPSYKEWSSKLFSNNNKEIADILYAGVEVYKGGDSIFYFTHAMSKEIATDKSFVFSKIKEMTAKLKKIDIKKQGQYEEGTKLYLGHTLLHSVKFKGKKTYTELVFKYLFGKYLLWDIKIDEKI